MNFWSLKKRKILRILLFIQILNKCNIIAIEVLIITSIKIQL